MRQTQSRPDSPGVLEPSRNVDGRGESQGNDRADARDRHQPPAHVVFADDRQQLLMQFSDLLAKRPASVKHDAMISASSGMPSTSSRILSSNLVEPTTPTLSPKLRSRPRMSFSMAMAFSCSSLRAVNKARRFWLVSRPEKVDAHHLRDAARVIAIAFVDLSFEEGLGMPGLDADDR